MQLFLPQLFMSFYDSNAKMKYFFRWMFKLSEWAHVSSYDIGPRSGSSASNILVYSPSMLVHASSNYISKKFHLSMVTSNFLYSHDSLDYQIEIGFDLPCILLVLYELWQRVPYVVNLEDYS